jgi:hypothetical protein
MGRQGEEERSSEVPVDTRAFTFSEKSQRMCDLKDPPLPPFLQRAHRDWDFSDVMDEKSQVGGRGKEEEYAL